ncbi:hypothetical protein BKA93DRAFT_807189 [Sparassis latifolia]
MPYPYQTRSKTSAQKMAKSGKLQQATRRLVTASPAKKNPRLRRKGPIHSPNLKSAVVGWSAGATTSGRHDRTTRRTLHQPSTFAWDLAAMEPNARQRLLADTESIRQTFSGEEDRHFKKQLLKILQRKKMEVDEWQRAEEAGSFSKDNRSSDMLLRNWRMQPMGLDSSETIAYVKPMLDLVERFPTDTDWKLETFEDKFGEL